MNISVPVVRVKRNGQLVDVGRLLVDHELQPPKGAPELRFARRPTLTAVEAWCAGEENVQTFVCRWRPVVSEKGYRWWVLEEDPDGWVRELPGFSR